MTFDVYVAIPYSHPDPLIREVRFLAATKYTAHLIKNGISAFSPITHCHPMAGYGLGASYEEWAVYDERVMSGCGELHILALQQWSSSTGVAAEGEFFKGMDRPISLIDPVSYSAEPWFDPLDEEKVTSDVT